MPRKPRMPTVSLQAPHAGLVILPPIDSGSFLATAVAISEDRAREILLAAHAAWNTKNIRTLVEFYTRDMTFWTNWGGEDNEPRTITGRGEFLRHLAANRDALDCTTRVISFRLQGACGRASAELRLRDPRTGLRHVGTFRQVFTFSGEKIERLEEYHDASAMDAFRQLIVRADRP